MNDSYAAQAAEIIKSIGNGVPFETIASKIAASLGQAHADGASSLEGVDMSQLDLRQTIALEKIADHLGAFRKAHLDENAPVHEMRALLQQCSEVLRFPQMAASPELQQQIAAILRA